MISYNVIHYVTVIIYLFIIQEIKETEKKRKIKGKLKKIDENSSYFRLSKKRTM